LEARQPTAAAAPLSAQVAVWVLVECIKQPQLRADQIAAYIQARRQLTVSTESINAFFEHHGLKKSTDIVR
jgi:hypothetical protein